MTPKTIEVEKGNEFKIKIREIPNEGNSNAFAGDIFGDAYIQATTRVEEIVTATDNINNDKSQDNYLNNIIAFTGERGQGKSSAMLSFTHYLENVSKIDAFKINTKKYNFVSLETVDPSTFEDMHNILEVVIARMYNNFSEKYKKDTTCISRDKKNEINELFQKAYESLCLIRNPKKLEELEYDYEGSIQKIAQIGDSTNLHKILQKLIKSYLNIMTEGNCKSFLIIPIDDLDINIKYAYKITEQIRKYLVLPNVLIIMAINIDQLKKCAEMEFRKQFSTLMNRQNPLSDNEFINMAAKYVEKLIPDGRKISLPEIRAISQSGNDAVELVYHERGSRDNNILKKDNRQGIEERILGYIYDKTELVFIKPENGVHRLIPNTLRGVVNLLSVLGKMEDIKEGESKRETQLRNILLFEDYFLHTWMPDNLDDGNMKIINELLSVSDFEKHRLLCVKLMDVIENTQVYTVDPKNNVNQLDITLTDLRTKYSKQNTNHMSYSLGDVFDILYILSTRYINTQTINVVFAIKTVYTLTMHKICLNETEESKLCPNNIYRFVGDSLWGSRVTNALRGDRARFLFHVDKFLGAVYPEKGYFSQESKLNGEEKQLVIISILAKFPQVDKSLAYKLKYIQKYENAFKIYEKSLYEQVLYKNNLIADNYWGRKNAEFSIDNLFITFLNLDFLEDRSGLNTIGCSCQEYFSTLKSGANLDILRKIVINMELNEYVLNCLIEKRNLKEKAETDEAYIANFIDVIENALGENSYVKLAETKTRKNEVSYIELFTDKELEAELKGAFVKSYENRITKIDDIQNEPESEDEGDTNETKKSEDVSETENDKQDKDTSKSVLKPVLSDEENIFDTIIYFSEIDERINSVETNGSLQIILDMKKAKLNKIKKETIVLAKVVAYYRTTNILEFSQEIIDEIKNIYTSCVYADKLADYNQRLAFIIELRKRYMSVANKMKDIIESLNKEQ